MLNSRQMVLIRGPHTESSDGAGEGGGQRDLRPELAPVCLSCGTGVS